MSVTLLDRYYAAALQLDCDGVHPDTDRASARARMKASLARIDTAIAGAKRWVGEDLRLVVLPEYILTGPPWGEPIPAWADKAALADDGPEYETFAQLAQRHGVHLAGNAYELDPHFPGLYFQASFVFDDTGRRVLRYRRLVSMFAPTPHDVWDRYLEIYGLDAVFPVADTTLGKLAAIASEEILYPEIARCHAIRGAEVLLHSTGEMAARTLTPKQIARRARALENLAYVVSANCAATWGIDVPADSSNGFSDIIDYMGNQLVQAGQGVSMAAAWALDLAGLRAYRRRPGMGNLLSRQALDLYAASFTAANIRKANGLLVGGKVVVPDRAFFRERQQLALARLAETGVVRSGQPTGQRVAR
ncbi:MAG: nitrilase-related carbon-nitrogen hydrolase [Steroidobacteraceae bacterium]